MSQAIRHWTVTILNNKNRVGGTMVMAYVPVPPRMRQEDYCGEPRLSQTVARACLKIDKELINQKTNMGIA